MSKSIHSKIKPSETMPTWPVSGVCLVKNIGMFARKDRASADEQKNATNGKENISKRNVFCTKFYILMEKKIFKQ